MSAGIEPMSAEEHRLLDELVASRFGISFPEEKRSLLERKLAPRLRALRLGRFLDYYLRLHGDGNGELSYLARLLTNNESYFFRETHQFQALFEAGLGKLRPGLARCGGLRLLSAGCSSGEEPYTLAIYAGMHTLACAGLAVEIDAFDLDVERLATAERAVYGPHSLRSASEEQIRAYFRRHGADAYELTPRYRTAVRFFPGNILEPSTWARGAPYDAIFCRNVLIYFSPAALHRAVEQFAAALRPGGLLLLGHAESIIGLSARFRTLRLKRAIAYERV